MSTAVATIPAGHRCVIDLAPGGLEDYTLVRSIKTGRGNAWSGLTCHLENERVYMLGKDRLRVMDPAGRNLLGRDIDLQELGQLEDLVFVGNDKGRAMFCAVEGVRWEIVRFALDDSTRRVRLRDCERFSLEHLPGARQQALTGLGIDMAGQDLWVAQRAPARLFRLPLGVLEQKPAFELSAKVEAGSRNEADVRAVQDSLVAWGELDASRFAPGVADGATVAAIERFQKRIGFRRPDGSVDPKQRTHRGLLGRGWVRPVEGGQEVTDSLLQGPEKITTLTGLCSREHSVLLLDSHAPAVVEIPEEGGLAQELARIKLVSGESGLQRNLRHPSGVALDEVEDVLYIVEPSYEDSDWLHIFRRKSHAGVPLPEAPPPPPPAPVAPAEPVADAAPAPSPATGIAAAPAPVDREAKEGEITALNRDFRLSGEVCWPDGGAPADLERVRGILEQEGFTGATIRPDFAGLMARIPNMKKQSSKDIHREQYGKCQQRPDYNPLEKLQNEYLDVSTGGKLGACQSGASSVSRIDDALGCAAPGSYTHRALLAPFPLVAAVGDTSKAGANRPQDVQRVKERLWAIGLLEWGDIDGNSDATLHEAIRKVQQQEPKSGRDGVVGPGGLTHTKLLGFRQELIPGSPWLESGASAHYGKVLHINQIRPHGRHSWKGLWTCGPTSVAAALRYLRPRFGRGLNQFELVHHLADKNLKSWSTSAGAMPGMLDFCGLPYTRIDKKERHAAWTREQLAQGRLIVCNGSHKKSGHWVLVVGLDKQGRFQVHDPGQRLSHEYNQPWSVAKLESFMGHRGRNQFAVGPGGAVERPADVSAPAAQPAAGAAPGVAAEPAAPANPLPDQPVSEAELQAGEGVRVVDNGQLPHQEIFGKFESFVQDPTHRVTKQNVQREWLASRTPLSFFTKPNDIRDRFDVYRPGGVRARMLPSQYGYPRNTDRQHHGEDLYFPPATPIHAPFDCKVAHPVDGGQPIGNMNNGKDCGYYITIQSVAEPRLFLGLCHVHGTGRNSGWERKYPKEAPPMPKPGDTFQAGQLIALTFVFGGKSLSRGYSHLHLDAIWDGGSHPSECKACSTYKRRWAPGSNRNPLAMFNAAKLLWP